MFFPWIKQPSRCPLCHEECPERLRQYSLCISSPWHQWSSTRVLYCFCPETVFWNTSVNLFRMDGCLGKRERNSSVPRSSWVHILCTEGQHYLSTNIQLPIWIHNIKGQAVLNFLLSALAPADFLERPPPSARSPRRSSLEAPGGQPLQLSAWRQRFDQVYGTRVVCPNKTILCRDYKAWGVFNSEDMQTVCLQKWREIPQQSDGMVSKYVLSGAGVWLVFEVGHINYKLFEAARDPVVLDVDLVK